MRVALGSRIDAMGMTILTERYRKLASDAGQAKGGPGGVIVGGGGGGEVVVVESSAASECRQADGRSRRPAGGKLEGGGDDKKYDARGDRGRAGVMEAGRWAGEDAE